MNRMNDSMLSQDEIDALLKISEAEDQADEMNELTDIEIDTLGEIGNISIGSSATTLSTLLNQKVEITTPTVSVVSREELIESFNFDRVNIQVNYIEGFSGQNVLVILSRDASIISDIMLGGDGTNPDEELTDIHLSAVQEAMNQMMGAAATSMSTIFNKRVDISPPAIQLTKENEQADSEEIGTAETFVKVSFRLKVGNLIDSCFKQLMPIDFAKSLVGQLLDEPQEEDFSAPFESEAVTKDVFSEEPVRQPTAMPVDRKERAPQYMGNPVDHNQSNVQQAVFSNFEQVKFNQSERRNLDMLLDIPLKVTVELGRTKRSIKDILELTSGSIVELDKLAGEPVDILVNEKLIARGEVVVIEENFGVRVTDIISQSDRIKNLK